MSMENQMKMKYYMIDADLLETIIELMLESVETSGVQGDRDNVMFFTWLYDELVELPQLRNVHKYALDNKRKILKNTKKELTDEEIKILHYLNHMIEATADKTKSTNKKSKQARNIIKEEAEKIVDDIKRKSSMKKQMSLKEIKEFLIDDPELTNEERMDLYYEEHLRIKQEKEEKRLSRGAKPLDQIMKELGILPAEGSDKKKNK